MMMFWKKDKLGMAFLYGFMIGCIQALLVILVLDGQGKSRSRQKCLHVDGLQVQAFDFTCAGMRWDRVHVLFRFDYPVRYQVLCSAVASWMRSKQRTAVQSVCRLVGQDVRLLFSINGTVSVFFLEWQSELLQRTVTRCRKHCIFLQRIWEQFAPWKLWVSSETFAYCQTTMDINARILNRNHTKRSRQNTQGKTRRAWGIYQHSSTKER